MVLGHASLISGAAVVLILGFWFQNIAEWRGGGPVLPRRWRRFVSRRFVSDRQIAPTGPVRLWALLLVSLIVPVLMAVAVWLHWGGVITMIAAALAASALFQMGASIVTGQLIPGTISGLAVMLPPAVWLLSLLGQGRPAIWMTGWSLAGLAVTPLLLGAVWWLAARLRSGS